ncbi:MAG TPA: thiopeptide-type bacteriocin biosynthesis protein [Polyangia bacterium]|jgi:thiopeptide-type bacteriocin biosynthesis protein|nr:thiopeptide-type bacteriocin biosynthesis protein [Polyangia bacterium]
MPYVPLDRFLLRAPLLPWTSSRDPARRLLRDPLGPIALALASPTLAAHPQGAPARRALARYGRRAAFRPTPAGLLAGVAVGALGARSRGATGQPRAHWAITWARLAALGRALLADLAIRGQVRLRRAPSLLCAPDRIRWLAFGESMAEQREAELDDRLAHILDAAQDWSTWAAVRQAAESPADTVTGADAYTSADGLDELLLLLIDDGLLHHDLMPPLVGPPPAEWMLGRLRRLEPPAAEAAALAQVLDALEHAGASVDQALALLDRLPDRRRAGETDSWPLVATLVHQPARPLTLDRRVVERAALLAPLVFRLQQALMPPVAERFLDPEPDEAIAIATELYGEGALDLEALALGGYGVDPAAPFDRGDPGTPVSATEAAAPPRALLRLLVDEITAARAAGRAEIALDPAALDEILPARAPPPTCELFLTPTAARTGWLLGLHAPAGSTWGRFASALGAPLIEALGDLHAAEVASHAEHLRLDVAFAPSLDLADLCTHPPARPQMLALSTWPPPPARRLHEQEHGVADADAVADAVADGTDDPEEAITPAELTIVSTPAVDPPALVLHPFGVVPSPLTRLRSTTAPPGVFRLLAGFSLHRQFGPWALILGPLADLAHVPRLSIDGFVVSPASWRLPAKLDARALRRWRRGQAGIPAPPRFVQVGDEDALLPVDLAAPDALADLRGQSRAWEIWPPLEAPAVDQDGRRIEAVIALHDQPDAVARAQATARARAIVGADLVPPPHVEPAAPGWRTWKLFGVEEHQNQILVDAVAPAIHAARAAGEIDCWFFLRYTDERERRPHLRLRVHAPSHTEARAQLDAFAARLDDALAPARDTGAVALVESGPYHPEVARFGGAATLPAVMRLFEIDSELACALLAGGDDEALDHGDPIDELVAVFDSLAAGLGLSRAERREFARRRRDAEAAWAAPASDDQRRARDADFRARARGLRTLLGAPPPGGALTLLLDAHQAAVADTASAIDPDTCQRLAAPLLHLAAVRLIGVDREAEARAYALWERTLEGLLRSPPPPPPPRPPASPRRAPPGSDSKLN